MKAAEQRAKGEGRRAKAPSATGSSMWESGDASTTSRWRNAGGHPLPTGEGRRGAPIAESKSLRRTQRSGGVRGFQRRHSPTAAIESCVSLGKQRSANTNETASTPHPGPSALTASKLIHCTRV